MSYPPGMHIAATTYQVSVPFVRKHNNPAGFLLVILARAGAIRGFSRVLALSARPPVVGQCGERADPRGWRARPCAAAEDGRRRLGGDSCRAKVTKPAIVGCAAGKGRTMANLVGYWRIVAIRALARTLAAIEKTPANI